jgi:Cu(I)/Ag(I) efflux system periplasmic protein CusF
MILALNRVLLTGLLPIALSVCTDPGPISANQDSSVPLGIDLGSSGPVLASAQSRRAIRPHDDGKTQMAHAGRNDVHGTGTVNSVDPAQHKVNVTHNPIPEIGWPTMTMDFPVAPSVDLRLLKPGTRVNFTIERGQGGMYEIQAISPAGGGR